MRGENKADYRRPRTGEKRRVRQPLRIDGLSQEVRETILKARTSGKTWEETAEEATKIAGEPLAVTTVHRWYDLRVEQVQKEVMAQSARARAFAEKLARSEFRNISEAAINVLSSEAFTLAQSANPEERLKAGMILVQLAARIKRGELETERLELDRKKFAEIDKERLELDKQKLEATRSKVQALKQDVEKKKLSAAELAAKLDEIYDIGRTNV